MCQPRFQRKVCEKFQESETDSAGKRMHKIAVLAVATWVDRRCSREDHQESDQKKMSMHRMGLRSLITLGALFAAAPAAFTKPCHHQTGVVADAG